MNEELETLKAMHHEALDILRYRAAHPNDVLLDPQLSRDEKREILARWASDAHAVENAPTLRHLPTGGLLDVDEILEALKALDARRGGSGDKSPARQPRKNIRPRGGLIKPTSRDDDDDPPPSPAGAMIPPMPLPSGPEAGYAGIIAFSALADAGWAA